MTSKQDIANIVGEIINRSDLAEARNLCRALMSMSITKMDPEIFWLVLGALACDELRAGLVRIKADAIVAGDTFTAESCEHALVQLTKNAGELRHRAGQPE